MKKIPFEMAQTLFKNKRELWFSMSRADNPRAEPTLFNYSFAAHQSFSISWDVLDWFTSERNLTKLGRMFYWK